MKIAFALIPEKGHINPYIGPAQALLELGQTVVVAAPGPVGAQMAAAGLSFLPDLIPAVPGSRPTHGRELVALIQDRARLAQWIEQLLLGGVEPQVEACRAFYRRHGITAVVVDPLFYAAAIAAEAEGLPWASVSNSLNPVIPADFESDLLATTRALDERRRAVFASYGVHPAFRGCDVLSPRLTIAFTTEAICGVVPGVELVGPSFPLAQRGDERPMQPLPAGRPVVYASFGSQIYHWPELFGVLREAAAQLGVTLVLSAGALAADIPASPECQVYDYAPQRALLSRATVFVTHGGANSFMEAIHAGVPMLLSPMCNDQFHQAEFLRRLECGVAVDLRGMSIKQVTLQLDYLLSSTRIRRRMAALSASYRASDGARTAARLIVERLGS